MLGRHDDMTSSVMFQDGISCWCGCVSARQHTPQLCYQDSPKDTIGLFTDYRRILYRIILESRGSYPHASLQVKVGISTSSKSCKWATFKDSSRILGVSLQCGGANIRPLRKWNGAYHLLLCYEIAVANSL